MEAVCGSPLALPCPWLAAFALLAFAAFWSAALLPVLLPVALCAFWSVAGVGVVAAAPLWAFWSVVLVALLEEAELEAGAVPLWLFMSPEAAFEFELGVAVVELELDVAPGAVAAFWSVVLDGAAVGFAWLEVWSVAAGVVEVWPEVALGAVDWLELAGAAVWFISELLLELGAVLVVDDWLELVAGAVALGVWLFWLLGSVVVLDVWARANPADSSNAEHV
jgi:hypothetical protein